MKGLRYRTELRTIEVRVPVTLVLKKSVKVKPAKRRMRQYRIYEIQDKKWLTEEYYRLKQYGKLTFWDMCISRIPLQEGHTTKYRNFASVPEIIRDWGETNETT